MSKEKVYFTPFSDGYGIVGYYYHCLNCGYDGRFSDGCGNCSNEWPDIDQDDWYDNERKKPKDERAWNLAKKIDTKD